MTEDCVIHFVFLGILNQAFILTTVMTPDGSLEVQKWRQDFQKHWTKAALPLHCWKHFSPEAQEAEASGWFLLETNGYDLRAAFVSHACGADTAISPCTGLACKLNYKELALK